MPKGLACTCTDTECPFNPANHAEGCDLCVAKCQRKGEIPSCFFKLVSKEPVKDDDYTFAGFANYVAEHQ